MSSDADRTAATDGGSPGETSRDRGAFAAARDEAVRRLTETNFHDHLNLMVRAPNTAPHDDGNSGCPLNYLDELQAAERDLYTCVCKPGG